MTTDHNVLVLGCGPAGLLAAHAVEMLGGSVAIMSIKQKSELPGAQYLHAPIPGLNQLPEGRIRTVKRGTAEGYALKVYGRASAPTSWEQTEPERDAWNLRLLYDRLWDRFEDRIVHANLNPPEIADAAARFPLTISSIPAPKLCTRPPWSQNTPAGHRFEYETMWVVDWAPPEIEDNTVLYSGEPEQEWYRSSRVFGVASTEATQHCFSPGTVHYIDPPQEGEWEIKPFKKGIKVVETNCDCQPNVVRVGRYGKWEKGVLTHHAFQDAADAFSETFSIG